MSTHLTQETLGRLHRGELDPAGILTALRHLATCEECVARSQRELPVDREAIERNISLERESESEHLDATTQLIPYVNQTLSAAETEIVESHMEDCQACRAEVMDLRAFRERFARRRRRIPLWAFAAALGAVAIAALLLMRQPRTTAPAPVIATQTHAPQPAPENAPPAPHGNAEWDQLVADAIEQRRLPYLEDDPFEARPSTYLRGPDDPPPAKLEPAGITIADARPRFTWDARDGATYVVLVFAGDREIARSPVLSAAEWRPATPLLSGRIYTWQVEVRRGDEVEILPAPPAPPAQFRVIRDNDRREIENALAQRPQDFLLHAALYARAGLEAEARLALSRALGAGDGRAKSISAAPAKKS